MELLGFHSASWAIFGRICVWQTILDKAVKNFHAECFLINVRLLCDYAEEMMGQIINYWEKLFYC